MASTKDSSGTELYHRQSSGLVREGRPLDAILFNFAGGTIGPVIGWILLFALPLYAGANVLLTILIAGVLVIGVNVTYALFASIMPRSGGDYVFISRTFHPFLGFTANASFMFYLTFYIGTAGALIGQLGLSAAFRQLAVATGDLSLASWGDWFYTDWGKFISGLAMIALVGPLLIYGNRGLRTYFRFQKWVFAFCFATLAVTMVATIVMSRSGFEQSFNEYAAHFGATENAYATIVSKGGGHGSFSLEQTLLAVTWPTYMLTFLLQSAYWAGEHKKGLRGHLIGMPVAFAIALTLTFVMVAVSLRAYGVDFLHGLGVVDPATYGMGFAPYYVELVGAWTGPVVGIVMALGLSAWLVTYVPVLSIMVTRSMLAWSLDGVAPAWLGQVDRRRNNPVNATLVCYGVAIVLLALYAFTPWFSVVTALLAFDITFFITCIAAIAFPYRHPRLFEESDGNVRVGRLPLLSITGAVGALGIGAVIVILLLDANSGTSLAHNRGQLYGVIAAFIVAGALYVVSAAVQRRRGVDVAASYHELPVE